MIRFSLSWIEEHIWTLIWTLNELFCTCFSYLSLFVRHLVSKFDGGSRGGGTACCHPWQNFLTCVHRVMQNSVGQNHYFDFQHTAYTQNRVDWKILIWFKRGVYEILYQLTAGPPLPKSKSLPCRLKACYMSDFEPACPGTSINFLPWCNWRNLPNTSIP